MYNPDYPTDNNGGFQQHTYQPQQNMYNYWDGGMGMMNTYMNPYNMDSRRNGMMPMNPVNPFNQFGQTQQNNVIPENMVQPFSSYPPSTPMGNASGGLNSMLADSRRNINQPTTNNNPWAPQQNMPAPIQPAPQPQQNPYMNQYAGYQNPYGGYFDIPRIDMNTAALYGGLGSGLGFEKKGGTWDNYYTQTRALPMPVVDWRQQQMNPIQNQYQPQMQPQYPIQQMQTTQQNWKDIAERNWSNSGI